MIGPDQTVETMLMNIDFLWVKAKPQVLSRKLLLSLFIANVIINRVRLNKSASTPETN